MNECKVFPSSWRFVPCGEMSSMTNVVDGAWFNERGELVVSVRDGRLSW